MTTYCLREHDCFFAQAISSTLRSTRPRLDGRGFLHTLSQACCILLANLLEDHNRITRILRIWRLRPLTRTFNF